MREHVHEIYNSNIKVVARQRLQLLQEFLSPSRVVYLMVAEGVMPPVSPNMLLNQRSLVKILSFLLVLVYP